MNNFQLYCCTHADMKVADATGIKSLAKLLGLCSLLLLFELPQHIILLLSCDLKPEQYLGKAS